MMFSALARPGYLMIERAEIENFRGFREAKLEGLRRINIIVGDNGAGKTGLMEAFFAGAAYGPQVLLKLKEWRGTPRPAQGLQQRIYRDMWSDFFFDFDTDKVASISLHGNSGDSRSLRMFRARGDVVLPLDPSNQPVTAGTPISFEYADHTGNKMISTPTHGMAGWTFQPMPDSNVQSSFLASRAPFYTRENASHFSDLRKENKETEFVQAMLAQFPELDELSVEEEHGVSTIFARNKLTRRRFPIHLLGDGMNKLAAIFLGIAHNARGILFCDEIDSGLHFSRYAQVWKQIAEFATSNQAQIFTTTHSWECLQAASKIIDERASDFALIQVKRDEGQSLARVVAGENAAAAIEAGIEVRG